MQIILWDGSCSMETATKERKQKTQVRDRVSLIHEGVNNSWVYAPLFIFSTILARMGGRAVASEKECLAAQADRSGSERGMGNNEAVVLPDGWTSEEGNTGKEAAIDNIAVSVNEIVRETETKG